MNLARTFLKNTYLFSGIVVFLCASFLNAQTVTGSWEGKLKLQGTELRLVFNLSETDGVYEGTMDSPDQNAFGIPLSEVKVQGDSLMLKLQVAGISYNGKFKEQRCEGIFKQGSFTAQMLLQKTSSKEKKLNRPQEPKAPFDYEVEEVKFYNKSAEINLSGTLTIPKGAGPFPAVVLISGSGAQDRNEEIFGHKPFLLIADALTKKGIAVLRFDDRGTADSEGNHLIATSADFATDVSSAVDFLNQRAEVDQEKIGLIGHSEGGIIAPMVHTMRTDISYMILLAGTGVRGDQLLLEQQRLIGAANGMTESQLEESSKINGALFRIVVDTSDSNEVLSQKLKSYLKASVEENEAFAMVSENEKETYVSGIIQRLTSPWMLFFLRYDPAEALKKTTCKVLALNGEKDLQVPSKMNLNAIKKALNDAGNKCVETVEFKGLNHLFQVCNTGAPSEYATIEQTMAPVVLETMSTWILGK